ncbi:MAG: hypothetical protein ACRENZ_06855 [Thermodesulfobacteriota bacterium]
MNTKRDYGTNKLSIEDYPQLNIIPFGTHVGTPCLELLTGDKINLTNQAMMDYIDADFPLTHRVLLRGKEDPTIQSEELYSYIKYHDDNSNKQRIWQMITNGNRYITRLLYQVNHITINVQTPSSGKETAPEFISWCAEDRNIKDKIEFVFVTSCNAEDISFVRYEIPKLATYKRPITIIPSYWNEEQTKTQFEICDKHMCLNAFEELQAQPSGWRSYLQFAETFMDTLRYRKVRLHPDLQRIFGLKQFEGLL